MKNFDLKAKKTTSNQKQIHKCVDLLKHAQIRAQDPTRKIKRKSIDRLDQTEYTDTNIRWKEREHT